MTEPLRMLGANIRVAINLAHAAEMEAIQSKIDEAWSVLIARAKAVGCRLQRCYYDPECDGCECGCGPGLFDRDDNSVGDCASDEPSQDLAMFTQLVAQLESTGGYRK